MTGCRIIIIGGGISGLSAADHLIKNGLNDVTILEATNRLGGRMRTARFGSDGKDIVEMGANWIHGAAGNNSIITLANEHKLLEGSVLLNRMEGYCYRSDGRAVSPEVTDKLWTAFNKWFTTGRSLKSTSPIIWADHLRKEFRGYLTTLQPSEHEDARSVFNCLMNLANFKFAGSVREACIEGLGSGKGAGIPGGNVKVPLGMSSIIGAVSKNIPCSSILLGQAVTGVDWYGSEVKVTTNTGKTYTADHVIVTCSLGHLKANHARIFTPALPQWKSEAISTVPFGKVDKVFLQWDQPFWTPGSGGVKLAWKEEEAEIKSRDEWYKRIFSFDEVLNNPNVLVAWISGEEAAYMETLSDDEVLNTCAELLAKFLNNPSLPKPSKVLVTRWCTDPYYCGSYIYLNKDMQKKPGYINALSRPLTVSGNPRVLFSGSATIDWAYSTMHGGRSSGLREAERIINYYSKGPKSAL